MRIGFLLVLFIIGRGQADTLTGGGFDQGRLIAVYSEALAFIAPRILDPVPVPLLTVWGLQGLTVLDPSLRVVATEVRLQLVRQGEIVLDIQAPKDDASDSWAKAAAALTAASLPVSAPVRRAGTQGIIEAFFNQLFSRLDPYSRYVPPVEASEDRARRAGRAGLGLTLGPKSAGPPSGGQKIGGQKTGGRIRASERGTLIEVVSVVRDSPAAIAGIRPNDILIAVDGQQTLDQDPVTVAALLAGAEGSAVTVSWRGRDGRTREAQLVRVMVPPETVFAQRSDDVLVLRISSFSNSTASHMALSVQDALSEPHPVGGIVLDLRDNRGGLLRQAVTAADTFLPAGLVATTVGRDPDSKNVWRSAEGELAESVPVIVLVDGRTASAAEILAAALADRGRAVVVGSETVGKGMVQTIDPLPDGGELFVTWSQTLAPLGWPIQGLGVLPQVCTSLGQEALNRQLAALSTGFQPMAAAIRRSRAARIPVPASEVLEIRAPCPASEGRGSDLEAARLLIANPAAYAAALLPPIADRQSFGQPDQGAVERP
jgi:carboxyl-terminal processing protease